MFFSFGSFVVISILIRSRFAALGCIVRLFVFDAFHRYKIDAIPATMRDAPMATDGLTFSMSLRKMALNKTMNSGLELIKGMTTDTSPLLSATKTKICETADTTAAPP